MKVLNMEDLGINAAEVDKYQKEARILETLRHKHVIQYKGHEIKDDVL